MVSAAAGENHGGGGRRRRRSVGIAVAEAWRQIRCLMKRVNEEESNIPVKRCRMPTKERNSLIWTLDGRAMNKNRKQVKYQIKTSDALRSWFVVVDHRFITFYMAVSIFSLINYFFIYIYIIVLENEFDNFKIN